ncbi:MAG: hypothetical protein ACYC1P_14865, partial [Gaiellaceae bacterium]
VNVRSIAGHTTVNTGEGRDVINVGSGVRTAPEGATLPTPEEAALDTDRGRGVDEIAALLVLDGGGHERTGTITGTTPTTITDVDARFPTALPGTPDPSTLWVDILTQSGIGTLELERDLAGALTGRMLFTATAAFGALDTFSFLYTLWNTGGERATHLATIKATDLDASRRHVVDAMNALTRAAHLVSLAGLRIDVLAANGAVKRSGEITANTDTTVTVLWDGVGTFAAGDRYRIFGTAAYGDLLNVDDTGDPDDSRLDLTQTTLTGLDMPTVAEVQTIFVQAKSGTYTLSSAGHGSVVLDYSFDAAQVRERLIDLYGFDDILVTESRTTGSVTYTVAFVGLQAGIDHAPLTWDSDRSGFVANPDASADVQTATVRDGRLSVLSEVQTIEVDAVGGTYTLESEGFGEITLDFDLTGAELEAALIAYYGFSDLTVGEDRTPTSVAYTITFTGAQAGRNLPPLLWTESRETTNLLPGAGFLVDVRTSTLKDGYALNTVQTLTVDGTGSFKITLLGRTTDPIAHDVTAAELQRILDTILNPNNANPALPYTDNVAVTRRGNDFFIVFQGEHSVLSLEAALIATTGDLRVRLTTRVDGLNYYGIETLNIGLGSGDDVVNVRGTSAVTNLATNDGDDRIFVSSEANIGLGDATPLFLGGNLDDLDGTLNLSVGSGRHVLLISDESATAGDGAVLISDEYAAAAERDPDVAANAEIFVVGLATGSLTYAAEADGNFADGITIWSGYGDDAIAVDGTHERAGLRTATSLNTGLGDDIVTVDLLAGDDGFFVLNAQGPYNSVLPLSTDISAGDHRTAADVISVYLDGVLVDLGLVAVDYTRNTISLALSAAINSIATVVIHRLGALLATESFRLPLMPTTDRDIVHAEESTLPLVVFGGQDDDE